MNVQQGGYGGYGPNMNYSTPNMGNNNFNQNMYPQGNNFNQGPYYNNQGQGFNNQGSNFSNQPQGQSNSITFNPFDILSKKI